MESLPYDDMPDCCCKGAEDNKKLQQENTELKSQLEALQAHVGRLRAALMKVVDDSELGIVPKSHIDFIKLLLAQTERQSLKHIEARVEEETIGRCVDIVFPSSEVLGEELDNMPRKYAKQAGGKPT